VRVLVTGGVAGFVGGKVAVALATRQLDRRLVEFDNVCRPGSELYLARLRQANIRFGGGRHWGVIEPSVALKRSLVEARALASFSPSKVMPRFLSYTKSRLPSAQWLARASLRMGITWRAVRRSDAPPSGGARPAGGCVTVVLGPSQGRP
jgi:hypothetical protein